MALLEGVGALLFGALAVGGFFLLWDRGLGRYGRKADVLAVSAILAFLLLVVLLVVSAGHLP